MAQTKKARVNAADPGDESSSQANEGSPGALSQAEEIFSLRAN
jgi:hypothetical protein